VPPVVRFLLKVYMEEVDGTLAMNFRSGSWTGSEVSYLDQRAGWRRAPAVLWRIPLVGENAGEKAGERE
jgi:hypothetical protein